MRARACPSFHASIILHPRAPLTAPYMPLVVPESLLTTMPVHSFYPIFACLSGATAVAFGAFGAHALKSSLTPNRESRPSAPS